MTISRRNFSLGCAALVSAPAIIGASARAASRPYRIFMILARGETEVEQGFRDYFAARDIPVDIIVRDVQQDMSKVPLFVAEAKALRPDLVYTWSTPVTVAAVGQYDKADPDRHVTDVPVLYTLVTDPVKSRVVPTLESSGRNVTGTIHVVPLESQVRAIRAYRPFDTMAVLFNPKESNMVLQVEALRKIADQQGFKLIERPVDLRPDGTPRADTLPEAVADIAARRPEFLYIGPDTFVGGANRQAVTAAAVRHGLAAFSATELAVREGEALFGLVTRYYNLGRLNGYKAEQILTGQKAPIDIPSETLKRFSYLVRLDVAERLGMYPPMQVLNYAEVIR